MPFSLWENAEFDIPCPCSHLTPTAATLIGQTDFARLGVGIKDLWGEQAALDVTSARSDGEGSGIARIQLHVTGYLHERLDIFNDLVSVGICILDSGKNADVQQAAFWRDGKNTKITVLFQSNGYFSLKKYRNSRFFMV